MKITKVLSVILSVLMVLSTVNIFACAEGTENIVGETVVSENEEQISDETEETIPDETKKLSYVECFEGFLALCLTLITEGAAAPFAIAVISFAFTPSIVTLPVTLPISSVLGFGACLAGILGILFLPVGAGVLYINQ